MRQVNTIVYGSPWEMAFAQWIFTREAPFRNYNFAVDEGRFFVNKFVEDIVGFAKGAGFVGNVVLTSWHSIDIWAPDVRAAREILPIAAREGIEISTAFSMDIVAEKLNNHWCGPDGECRNFNTSAGHQCIPSVPDVVAWNISSRLRSR